MSNFGRGLAKEHFSEIISKSVHRLSGGSCLKLFSIYIALVAILFNRAERLEQCNFGGQLPKENSCITFIKSMHWLRRRSHLKVFLFLALAAILFNGAEQFEQFW